MRPRLVYNSFPRKKGSNRQAGSDTWKLVKKILGLITCSLVFPPGKELTNCHKLETPYLTLYLLNFNYMHFGYSCIRG